MIFKGIFINLFNYNFLNYILFAKHMNIQQSRHEKRVVNEMYINPAQIVKIKCDERGNFVRCAITEEDIKFIERIN